MIEYYPDSIYYPRETVEAKYKKGELAKVEERLMGFAERHKNRVWIISKEDSSEPSNEVLLDNLRAYLLVRGSLQPAADMADLIKEINKLGITVIMVTHDINSAVRQASHILHISSNSNFFGTAHQYIHSDLGKDFLLTECPCDVCAHSNKKEEV